MAKPPLISIPLDIPDMRVLQTEWTKAGELILTIESTPENTHYRRCGRLITGLMAGLTHLNLHCSAESERFTTGVGGSLPEQAPFN